MNMITGFIEPTEGEILVEGYDISKKPKKAKAQIGYMPEGVPLYSDLTVKSPKRPLRPYYLKTI